MRHQDFVGSRLAIALLLVCALFPAPGKAIVAIADVELEAQANAVQVRDGYVFVATDAGLEILDLTDPRAPVIASLATPGAVSEFALDGDLAYLACEGGLRIADVSDPSAPQALGSVDLPSFSFDVEIAADHAHAFVSTVEGVRIVDVSDPAVPAEIDLLDGPQLRQLARIGNTLFGVAWHNGLGGVAVLDVSDPVAPVPLPSIAPYGTPDEIGSPTTVAISADGDRLWLFDKTQYEEAVWRRFDVTTPAAPALLDTVFPGRGASAFSIASGLSIAGGLLDWVSCSHFSYGCRVARIDLSDPASPNEIGALSLTELHYRAPIAALGERAYLANGSRLRVIDFSQPEWPRALDSLVLPEPGGGYFRDVHDIERIGSLAYVAAGTSGLHIVDVSDPEDLVAVGQRDFYYGRNALDIAPVPPIAFVADPAGLRIATVANPANPYILADPLVPAWAVELAGGLGYAASGTEGLVVWNAAEPTSPQIVGSTAVTDARDVTLADGFAYLLGVENAIAQTYELVVVDIADPSAPNEVGRLALPGYYHVHVDVEVRGSIAYVLIDHDVYVIDVSSPAEPLPLGSFPVCGNGRDLEIRGDRLFAAGAYCGLDVFDIADPLRPLELGVVSDDATTSLVSGRIAYLGTQQGALQTFDLGPEYLSAPEPGALASSLAALGVVAWARRLRLAERPLLAGPSGTR